MPSHIDGREGPLPDAGWASAASLTTADLPPLAPDEHICGTADGPVVVVVYGDYECPHCAQADALLANLAVRRVFRHFPVVSKHPRSRMLASAAEAAGLQGAYWEFHELLYGDQGHGDDPHLWDRAGVLGLKLDRFEADRRSDAVAARIARDFRSGVRAGVTTTPTLFTGTPVPSWAFGPRRVSA